jgi:hypothetical protein
MKWPKGAARPGSNGAMKRICLLAVVGVSALGCDSATTSQCRTTVARAPAPIFAEDHLSVSPSERDAPLPGQPSRAAPRAP